MRHPQPCGFCKNKEPKIANHHFSVGPVLWFISCPCGHSGPMTYSEENAIKTWNRIWVKADDVVIEELVNRQNDFRTTKGA